ncbi:MAG: geranylgeranyl reductase family protein [Deltaproteobacteria bacterium]|nr:geranylgeranyl reductase family protein [Deltaproteobacteria bacterium]
MSGMHDVIVIGAGPAGCSAAICLCLRGRAVTILEKNRQPWKKLCAGGLPPKVVGVLPANLEGLVEQSVCKIRFGYEGRRSFELAFKRPVVHLVQRHLLDQRLVQQAVGLGARLVEGAAVVELQPEAQRVLVKTTKHTYQARVVIAADGALGAGARLLGHQGIRLCPAVQVDVKLSRRKMKPYRNMLACDFGVLPGGIGWVFPKRDRLSVGLCSFGARANLKAALEKYLRIEGLDSGRISPIESHPLSTWDGRRVFSKGSVLMVGDAAGLVNPLTGAGIRRACISGQLAAEAAHAYLAGGAVCQKDLASYDRRVNADLVDELARARLLARLFYRAPGLFYRIGVMNARINPWVGELLSGQKSYLEVFRELLSGGWISRPRPL